MKSKMYTSYRATPFFFLPFHRITKSDGLEGSRKDHQLPALHSPISRVTPMPETIVQMLNELCQAEL